MQMQVNIARKYHYYGLEVYDKTFSCSPHLSLIYVSTLDLHKYQIAHNRGNFLVQVNC